MPIKFGLIQMSAQKNIEGNKNKALCFAQQAIEAGCKIIILPELFATQYFCDIENFERFEMAENIQAILQGDFNKLASKHKVSIVYPFFEARGQGVFHNSLLLLDGTQTVNLYRKLHIPDDPDYYEKFYFTPGYTGIKVFDTQKVKLGTLICWDQWFPEAARLATLSGANVLVYPTAIGWPLHQCKSYNQKELNAWISVQRGHAVANHCYVIAVNRVGQEGGTQFWGNTFVIDPFGEIILQSDERFEGVLTTEIIPNECEKYHRLWPFLRDRRIDQYSGLLNILNK